MAQLSRLACALLLDNHFRVDLECTASSAASYMIFLWKVHYNLCNRSYVISLQLTVSNQKNVAVTVFRPMDVHSASWLLNEMLVMQFLNLQKENCNIGPFC